MRRRLESEGKSSKEVSDAIDWQRKFREQDDQRRLDEDYNKR